MDEMTETEDDQRGIGMVKLTFCLSVVLQCTQKHTLYIVACFSTLQLKLYSTEECSHKTLPFVALQLFRRNKKKVLVSDCNPTRLIGQCQPQKTCMFVNL